MQEESLVSSQEDPIIKVYKLILLINVFFFFFVKGIWSIREHSNTLASRSGEMVELIAVSVSVAYCCALRLRMVLPSKHFFSFHWN